MCRPKYVEQLRNIGIINSTTRLHLVGSFYEIYVTMHGSMNIKFHTSVRSPKGPRLQTEQITVKQFAFAFMVDRRGALKMRVQISD